MKHSLLCIAVASTLVACGGGAFDVTVKRAQDATAEDLAKCGPGAYFVPPAASAPAADHGKCHEYEVVPASAPAAASA